MKCIVASFMLALSLLWLRAQAQKDTTIEYLDNYRQNTTVDNAYYCRIKVRENKIYFVAMVRVDDGSRLFEGSYKDSSLAIADGLFYYYTNNVVTDRGYYHDGKQVGMWKSWNTDKVLLDSSTFDMHGNLLNETKFTYHQNKTLWRSVLTDSSHKKVTKQYDTAGVLVSEGTFSSNNGQTFLFYPNGTLKAHAVFKDGERVIYDFFDENGKKYTEQKFSQLKKP